MNPPVPTSLDPKQLNVVADEINSGLKLLLSPSDPFLLRYQRYMLLKTRSSPVGLRGSQVVRIMREFDQRPSLYGQVELACVPGGNVPLCEATYDHVWVTIDSRDGADCVQLHFLDRIPYVNVIAELDKDVASPSVLDNWRKSRLSYRVATSFIPCILFQPNHSFRNYISRVRVMVSDTKVPF